MSRTWRLMIVVLMAAFLVGCQGRVFLNLDVPIVIEPAPVYRSKCGVIFPMIIGSSYPLYNTDPTRADTTSPCAMPGDSGRNRQSVLTDRDGYFFMRSAPWSSLAFGSTQLGRS